MSPLGGGSNTASLKFWQKNAARMMVNSAPESRTVCSLGSTWGSPRPARSTNLRTPLATACCTN